MSSFVRHIFQKHVWLPRKTATAIATKQLNRSRAMATDSRVASSYVHGVGAKELTDVTLGELVDTMPERFGDREAVVDLPQGIRKTYVQYKDDIDKLAMGFLALNLKKGDRIGIWCPNQYEWLVTQFASAKIGLILATLNPAYQPGELEYCMKKVGIRALVTTDNFKSQDYYKLINAVVPEVANSRPGQIKNTTHPNFDTLIMISDKKFPGAFNFEDVLNAGGSTEKTKMQEIQKLVRSDDATMIQFTSGTTGKPKAATISHHIMINGCYTMSPRLGFNEYVHRICAISPLFHIIGCGSFGTLNGPVNGACLVYPSKSFTPQSALKAIQDEKCTIISGTPTMYLDMMNNEDFAKTDVSSIKVGTVGGGNSTPELMETVMNRFNFSGFVWIYGSTETNGTCFSHHYKDPKAERLSKGGRVMDFIESKIIDTNGNTVSRGTPGEICIRGYKVMKGYWNDPDKTKEVVDESGWYHTGDVGILNEDGSLKIVDRIKDMVIRGGENIYPREIEDFLSTHKHIEEIHVVGVPDERLGEEVCAWIKLKNGQELSESELKAFCKGKISHFKIPRYIRFVKDFPKSGTGKVQKFKIREEMTKILAENK